MKKVLIVTYYWPPSGGAGVQRWLMFAKYLPQFGIEPIIYTPENPSYPVLDKTLEKEISPKQKYLKTKIFEPYQFASFLQPNKTKSYQKGQFEEIKNQSALSRMMIWIRGNFFIPDARVGWVKPSVKFLKKELKRQEIDTIITTGPPHSLHLIGLKLKQQNSNLKWIADFRDPWTQISYHHKLKLSKRAEKQHKRLEHQVLSKSDLVISTSFTDAKNFKSLGAKNVTTITNGFDYNISDFKKSKNKTFNLVYSGGLEMERNPNVLWKAIAQLKTENEKFKKHFKLLFYGNLSNDVKQEIERFGLLEFVEEKGYVSHNESIQAIVNADLLWLTNFNQERSKGIIPGKLFEYLATGNPILSFGPKDADVQKILTKTNAGQHFTYDNVDGTKQFILEQFRLWENGQTQNFKNVEQFHRKELTETLSKFLFDRLFLNSQNEKN